MPTSVSAHFITQLQALVERFTRYYDDYRRASYSEAEARLHFIDPLFEALGWDVRNQAGLPRQQQTVLVERGETTGRPDYNFRINGETKFYVEAKAPHVALESTNAILQAKKYAWNTSEPFVYFAAVTDFEEFRFYDASRKPDPRHPNSGLIFAHRFGDYLQPQALENLWLLSAQEVAAGSLERWLTRSARRERERSPLDQTFLADLSGWREQLAKAAYKAHPDLSPAALNSVVQVFLDRLIFIRVGEDRGALPAGGLLHIARKWREEGRQRPITADLIPLFREVNDKLNGEIFKPHRCEQIKWDSALVAQIISVGLEPYNFAQIGVELLGSIYERYLGKTIRVTAKRAIVEDKPEVRKAGGVYYTPKYIVDYIVAQTVGRLIAGKTPKQIEKLRIVDPACGSGSFLLSAYQALLDYHRDYYAHQRSAPAAPPGAERAVEQGRLLGAEEGGEFRLSLQQKADIIRNNIFGVDIDAQAVEITMMSLYLKMLEGERGLISGRGVLPALSANIKCGNSLIGPDYFSGQLLPDDAAMRRINAFDWQTEFADVMRSGGFDCVIGNPPYIRIQTLKEWAPLEVEIYKQLYQSASAGNYDIYVVFVERALNLLSARGRLGFILPHKFFNAQYGRPLRRLIASGQHLSQVVHFGDQQVFAGATTYTCLLFLDKARRDRLNVVKVTDLKEWRASGQAVTGEIAASEVGEAEWNFTVGAGAALFKKLSAMPVKLGDVADIFVGLQTSADDVFIMNFVDETERTLCLKSKALDREWVFEKNLLLDSCELADYSEK
ncbi:MAG: Eco57I restriction-modification methylase domain-containing protein [Chloroflexi bacterium]|nr:Eco57I restriction-modification methylase domain-containing protein [Chloroflexota bacterium]